jgi:tetratricopeptide (TPR) repeat protein
MTEHRSNISIRHSCAGLLCCAALLHGAAAGALESEVVDHAKRARVSYDLRDWAVAIREYRAAYEAEPKSEYLFGLAQALRQSGDYGAAIYTFKAYRRLEGISPQQASATELLIARCEADQAKANQEQLQKEPPALAETIAVPDDPLASTGREPSSAESTPALAGLPSEAASSAAPSSPARAFYQDLLGDSLFMAGLAAAGVGTGLLLGGNSAMDDTAAAPTEADAREAIDSARQKQVLGGVLLPLGGVLVAGAVWRWVSVTGDAPEAIAGVSLGPGYVGYRGQF